MYDLIPTLKDKSTENVSCKYFCQKNQRWWTFMFYKFVRINMKS